MSVESATTIATLDATLPSATDPKSEGDDHIRLIKTVLKNNVVSGPASSTDNTLPRFDGTTGKLLQGSGVVVDDSNNVSTPGNVLSTGGVLGYGAGAGGTVTQATSKTTSVTLNKPSGKITMNNAALGASSSVLFTFLNSFIGSTDMLDLQLDASGIADTSNYQLWASAGSGAAVVVLRNISGGSLSESVGIRFAVKKVSQT